MLFSWTCLYQRFYQNAVNESFYPWTWGKRFFPRHFHGTLACNERNHVFHLFVSNRVRSDQLFYLQEPNNMKFQTCLMKAQVLIGSLRRYDRMYCWRVCCLFQMRIWVSCWGAKVFYLRPMRLPCPFLTFRRPTCFRTCCWKISFLKQTGWKWLCQWYGFICPERPWGNS